VLVRGTGTRRPLEHRCRSWAGDAAASEGSRGWSEERARGVIDGDGSVGTWDLSLLVSPKHDAEAAGVKAVRAMRGGHAHQRGRVRASCGGRGSVVAPALGSPAPGRAGWGDIGLSPTGGE